MVLEVRVLSSPFPDTPIRILYGEVSTESEQGMADESSREQKSVNSNQTTIFQHVEEK